MYGSIGKIAATSGGRNELAEILAGMGSMPECLFYVVSHDRFDVDIVGDGGLGVARGTPGLTRPPACAGGNRRVAAPHRRFELRFEKSPIGGIGP